jgi:hypothetical protein
VFGHLLSDLPPDGPGPDDLVDLRRVLYGLHAILRLQLPIPIDFVVMSDPAQLGEIVRRVRDGRLKTNIGNVATLDDAVAALNPPSDARGRRSSAFVREPHTPTNAS